MKTFRILSVTMTLVCALDACAQHTDIEIAIVGTTLTTDPRIGEGEFGESPNPANLADEPGFEIDNGVFMPGQVLGFNAVSVPLGSVSRNLWYWDGMGAVQFGQAADVLTIQHPVSMQSIMLDSSGGASTIVGFLIGAADSMGGLHQDLEFVLGNNLPADGAYLYALEMTSPGSGLSPSLPVYFVMASNVSELVHQAAVDYVADTFMIPEPSMLPLLALIAASAYLPPIGRRCRTLPRENHGRSCTTPTPRSPRGDQAISRY